MVTDAAATSRDTCAPLAQAFLKEAGHSNEDLIEAVKAEQAKNPDGACGMDTVGVILATLEYSSPPSSPQNRERGPCKLSASTR